MTPLREGVTDALRETRVVSAARLRASPVVRVVHDRVVVDLELFGYVPRRRALALLDPRPGFRRLAASWRVGRLRATLPSRTAELTAQVDEFLASARPAALTALEQLDLLERCVAALRELHHLEVLAGTLLPADPLTAASLALDVLSRHADEADSDLLVRRHPVLLALSPPAVGAPVRLPFFASSTATTTPHRGDLGPRELLRLRARWVQELGARTAWQVGLRLAERGVLGHAGEVAALDLTSLRRAVESGRTPADWHERIARTVEGAFSVPLPAQFRLSATGDVVPAARAGARPGGGVGAGGGRGTGPAVHGSVQNPPAPGDVLVVRDLQPALAAWLPGLAGLVAETGGTLSHLAILAREYDIPTVVGVHDALSRFPTGIPLLVDGTTGEVVRVGEEVPAP